MAVMTDGGADQTDISMQEAILRKKRKLEQESYGDISNKSTDDPRPKAEVSTQNAGSSTQAGLNGAAQLANSGSTEGGEKSVGGAAVGGAASGAAVGSMAGPVGTAVGAVVGAAVGTIGALASNKAKRKALARQIEADKYKAIAGIKQAHGQQEAAGLQNMISGLRSAFLGN